MVSGFPFDSLLFSIFGCLVLLLSSGRLNLINTWLWKSDVPLCQGMLILFISFAVLTVVGYVSVEDQAGM